MVAPSPQGFDSLFESSSAWTAVDKIPIADLAPAWMASFPLLSALFIDPDFVASAENTLQARLLRFAFVLHRPPSGFNERSIASPFDVD